MTMLEALRQIQHMTALDPDQTPGNQTVDVVILPDPIAAATMAAELRLRYLVSGTEPSTLELGALMELADVEAVDDNRAVDLLRLAFTLP